jgi:hypothetical protein
MKKSTKGKAPRKDAKSKTEYYPPITERMFPVFNELMSLTGREYSLSVAALAWCLNNCQEKNGHFGLILDFYRNNGYRN